MSTERKTNLFNVDHALLAHHYDLRLSVSVEERMSINNEATTTTSTPKFQSERIKNRTSYHLNDANFEWQVDVTEIVSSNLDPVTGHRITELSLQPSSKLKEIELEIEMSHSAMLKWLTEANEARVVEEIKLITESLVRLLAQLIPSESDSALDTNIVPIANAHYVRQINRINDRLLANPVFPNSSSSSSSSTVRTFIGPQPLPLGKRLLLASVKTMPYYITEKSDGLRSMLYVVSESSHTSSPSSSSSHDAVAVLVNRGRDNIKLFRVPGGHNIGQALKVGTVLDGELVFNRSFGRTVYLVFDVLSIDEKNCVDLPFHQRLKLINEEVMTRCTQTFKYYSQEMKEKGGMKVERPLELIRKVYENANHITQLMNHVHQQNNEYVYFNTER